MFSSTCNQRLILVVSSGSGELHVKLAVLVTNVGLNVTRGRFPGSSRLAWSGVSTKDARRIDKGMPVSPAMTEGSHAPLGVAENALPNLSKTFHAGGVVILSKFPPPPLMGADASRLPGRDPWTRASGSICFRRWAA